MTRETIGRYRLQAPLGQGGRGLVYRAVAEETGETVALKLLPEDAFASAAEREKFLEEARSVAGLVHPHLRLLYEVGEAGGRLYLAMEYLEGATLKSVLVSGRVEAETALAWGAEIADALTVLHAKRIVHGDLRPAKVFITKAGVVKLLDPGLWRLGRPAVLDPANLPAGLAPTRVASLAPEVFQGQEPDAKSDLFSLGSLLCEMLSGRQPFLGKDAGQTAQLVLHRLPEPPGPEAPAGLEELLERLLEKDPRARLEGAAEVAAALRAVAAGEPLPAAVEKRAVVVRTPSPLWWVIGALVLLLVAWFLYLGLTRP